MVDMQVGEENIIHFLHGHAQGDDITQAAGAKIKEEAIPVT